MNSIPSSDKDYPLYHVNNLNSENNAVELVPENLARKLVVVPLWLRQGDLVIACTDPTDRALLKELRNSINLPIKLVKASFSEIRAAIGKFYQSEPTKTDCLEFEEIVSKFGYLPKNNLEAMNSLLESSSKPAPQICRENDLINDAHIAEAVGVACATPFLRVDKLEIVYDFSKLLPWEMASQRKAIPLNWISDTLIVITPNLEPGDRLQDISEYLGVPVQPVICSLSAWNQVFRNFYLRGIPDPKQKDLDVVNWLIENNQVSGLDINIIQSLALQMERSFEDTLIRNNICSRTQWTRALSEISGFKLASEWRGFRKYLSNRPKLDFLLPKSIAVKFSILPLKIEEDQLVVAISKPDPEVIRLVEGFTEMTVEAFLLSPEEIQKELDALYAQTLSHKMPMGSKLGEILQKLGILTIEQLQTIEVAVDKSGKSFEQEIISSGLLDEVDYVEILSLQTGIPHIDLAHAQFEDRIFTQIPASIAFAHTMIPIWSTADEIWIVVADPFNSQGLKIIEDITGKYVHLILAPRSTILASFELILGKKENKLKNPADIKLLRKLVEGGFLTQNGAAQALNSFNQGLLPLDSAIYKASEHPGIETAQAISKIIGLPYADLQLEDKTVESIDPMGQFYEKTTTHDPIDEKAARLLSQQDAQRFSTIPIRFEKKKIVIAFADPSFEISLDKLKSLIPHKIIPVYSYRDDLTSAIQRVLGKKNIGTHLLLEGAISRSQLNNALEFAKNTGVRLGKALVNRGYISDNELSTYLAKQSSLTFIDLENVEIKQEIAKIIPPKIARDMGILPIQETAKSIKLGIVDPFNSEALSTAKTLLNKKIIPVLITENDLSSALEELYSQEYLAQSISELLERSPEDSAFKVLSKWQKVFFILFGLFSSVWIWKDFTSYIILINSLSTIFYVAFSSYRFYQVYRALSNTMEVPTTLQDLQELDDRDLPIYTILVPVYKEAEVLPDLLEALGKLDYPTTKLDIQVLMEQDDLETIGAFNLTNPPSHFHATIVPYGQPKTKPKACNYGLIHARGEYVVIFDAEDIPQPDQLKKIVVAFAKSAPEVVCIQSKLNYYNSEQNLLTRWFTVEYSMWFDLFLPGLSALTAPIPLGGTSNHFKKDILVEIGAWDPYNVTEDADLGIRLFKRGYQTAIIDSTTFEEANSQIHNWIRQRSRWMKGYIQTWLVHMRHPIKLIKEIGIKDFLSFQFVVGGTFFSALANPIYWLLSTLWFLLKLEFIQVIFPSVVFIMGAICLYVGNFAFTYMNVAGALRRGFYNLVKIALISPIYWALQSVAAWVGLIQLFYKPHFWEKTQHGLYTRPKEEDEDDD
jgi:glycosyltransferase XagB